ncbi:MAG: cation-translocating P-type ATPase, partial [Bacteroidetes bacterium]|nr:cation-translocating P-type ATPase [Bacteroidota bacterium]
MADRKKRPENFEEIELDVTGMECVNCANSIKTYLEKLNGIHYVNINFTSEVASVEYDPNLIEVKEIVTDIRKLGYDVIEEDDEDKIEEQKKSILKSERNNIIFSAVLTVIVMAISMSGHHGFYDLRIPADKALALLILFTSIAVFWNGKKFLTGAYHAAKNFTSDMNTLISIGVMSSYTYSTVIAVNHIFHLNIYALRNSHEVYFETAAMIISLILTGNYLESVLKSKTQTSIKKLKELQAKFVNIIRNGEEMFVPFNKVRQNDIVIVKSGDKIPVDGNITEGYCVIDESAMTGESMPVEKKQGDALISGTLMKNGYVKMSATRVGKETTLSRIINLVKEASNSKPKIQRLADKISAIFVPVVVSIAVITFLVWYFAIGKPFDESLLYAVSVLVIACPCALGLASPMAVVIGVGRAAENGILFNNVEAIENVVKVDTICLDKTGTLTTGSMDIKEINTFTEIPKEEMLKYVFTVEKYSNHPVAKSIYDYCLDNKIDISENVSGINNEDGMGISGTVDDRKILIGNKSLMEKNNAAGTDKITAAGNGVLYISVDGVLTGSVEFEDKIKPEAKETLARFRKMNLDLFLISGDSEEVTQKVAGELGIEKFS